MAELFSDGLFAPAVTLALLAWLVPKLLSMVMPEGVKALVLLAFFATFILFAISSAFFFGLYLWDGIPMSSIAAFGVWSNLVFFGRLGLIAGIIWGPIMLLSVAGLPRTWTKETW